MEGMRVHQSLFLFSGNPHVNIWNTDTCLMKLFHC